jgi:hypothetical protein
LGSVREGGGGAGRVTGRVVGVEVGTTAPAVGVPPIWGITGAVEPAAGGV